MTLAWDILLDDVSIADQVDSFQLRKSKGGYASELTLFVSDSSFYDQFVVTDIPELRIEVRTKIAESWVSQGEFYLEELIVSANYNSILSPSVWGRSKTAALGQPFASKVSKVWDEDTTCQAIMDEMADLCDLSITFSIDNYSIFANSYIVENKYPIDVISELAQFAGAYVTCDTSGNLVIKNTVFHPSSEDYEIIDTDIIQMDERIEYPKFGNRIRISAIGTSGAGYSVDLVAIDDECLPADGASVKTLLAFVTADSEAVPDNTIVTWSIESGATLEETHSGTGNYLLENRKHNADNYLEVSVDFPIVEVLGIWAYADVGNNNNFWDSSTCSFDGKVITIDAGFAFCDQALRITYVTGGCAVNKVTAGTVAIDVVITADVEGADDTLILKQGNTCACGSSLEAIVNPFGSICIGNLAHILIWATINNSPAVGYPIKARIKEGCGALSSENKILKTVHVLNETSYTRNTITGVTQVQSAIIPADTASPEVYLKTDTSKVTDLYSSHDGKLIDLNTVQESNAEVVIDYYADGATAISWRTLDVEKDCDAIVSITMADGTEAGLEQEVSLSAVDCSEPEEIPTYNEDYSDYDPDDYDQEEEDGGFDDDGNDADSGGVILTDCDVAELNRIMNLPNAVTDEEKDAARFGTGSMANCPPEGEEWGCSCADLCLDEIETNGSTYDESQTIHEIVIEDGETEGTPEYNEAFETEKQRQLAACESNCDDARQAICETCGIISYTTQSMAVDEEQTLEITDSIEGYTYSWAITSGGGSLSETEGASTVYTAPSTNPSCDNNPVITLSVGEIQCDSLEIAVTASVSGVAYIKYTKPSLDDYFICSNAPGWNCRSTPEYTNCDGVVVNNAVRGCHPDHAVSCQVGDGGKQNCVDNCYEGVVDVRTEQMIIDGCCPAALL